MDFNIEESGVIKIVRLGDARLDTTLAPDLKTKLLGLAEQDEPQILIDLKEVEYADSSGLGAILFGIRRARDNGGTCKLVNLNNRVLSLIRIAKLDHVIEAFDDEKEALKSFS
ncbi:MAG: STAS domain-containing protein [Deferribacteres bacterium]|nr:STAS domain-containing protein [candidate division KSB1 bacterium]MCB9509928.1 STAS domain-containing protein [Deferribacteres bacterium]